MNAAVFLRELRENAKWAAVIALVVGTLVYSLVRKHAPYLLFELADAPMVVFAPLAGLAMGVLQTLFETKPDNWAFVVHRPASRAGVFAAKCAAGLTLLYAAMAIPCLLGAAWVARPGNVRMPFQARMLLPSMAVVLTAGCFYFAGMVLTLRKARWLGTRLLPLGFAIVCALAVRFAAEFWQAALIAVVGQVIGAAAAWGAFATAGAFDRAALPATAATGAMVYTGALAIVAGIAGAVGIFQRTTTFDWWQLDHDGNALRVTTTVRGAERVTVVRDAAGNPIAEYAGADLNDPQTADRFVRFTAALFDAHQMVWPFSTELYLGNYRAPLPGIINLPRVAPGDKRIRQSCLFDVERRVIDMYDSGSRRLVGRVGPAGFVAGRATPAELFPGEPLQPWAQGGTHTLSFPTAVYWMELDHRRVRKLFETAPSDPVFAAGELPPVNDPTVFVATRTRLHLLRPSGEITSTAVLEPDLSRFFYSIALLPSNRHLVLWGAEMSLSSERAPVVLEFSTDRQAKLLRQTDTPNLNVEAPMAKARAALLGLAYPPAALPLGNWWTLQFLFQLGRSDQALLHRWMWGASLAGAFVAWLLGARYAMSTGRRAAWAAASLALGPASIVAMIAVNTMPVRERCAACGSWRPIARPQCPRCAATPPPAVRDGREIFEPAAAADFQPAIA